MVNVIVVCFHSNQPSFLFFLKRLPDLLMYFMDLFIQFQIYNLAAKNADNDDDPEQMLEPGYRLSIGCVNWRVGLGSLLSSITQEEDAIDIDDMADQFEQLDMPENDFDTEQVSSDEYYWVLDESSEEEEDVDINDEESP